MSIFESIRVGSALPRGEEEPIGVRETFKETCSVFTSNAEPKFNLEKDHIKAVKHGFAGWTEAFYHYYYTGEQLKNYQKLLTLHDGNEYIVQSYRSCVEGTCKNSLVLYFGGERIADALDDGELQQTCGTPQALGLLTEALRSAIGYKKEIEPLSSFQTVECEKKVKPVSPCVAQAALIGTKKLNDYIRKANLAVNRSNTDDLCKEALRDIYTESFQGFLHLQEEVIKERPECAQDGGVLALQEQATEILNKLKKNTFNIKCESYAEYYTGEAAPVVVGVSIVSAVIVSGGAAPAGLLIYGFAHSLIAFQKAWSDGHDVPEYNP